MLAPSVSEHYCILLSAEPILGTLGVEMNKMWPLPPPPASKEVTLRHVGDLSPCLLGDTGEGPFGNGPASAPIKVLIGLLGNAEGGRL